MTVQLVALTFVFVVLVALPFLPGLRELWRPKDDQPLAIDRTYTREPRYFGLSLREKLRPILNQLEAGLPHSTRLMELRHQEKVEIRKTLHLSATERQTGICIVLGEAVIESKGRLDEGYFLGSTRLGSQVRVRALACDGEVELGSQCQVDRWIDAEGDLQIGLDCRLGTSASSGKRLHLDHGCTFKRLWGLPVVTTAQTNGKPLVEMADKATIADTVVWGSRALSLPKGMALDRDIVVHTDLTIGNDCVIYGNIKAHGEIHINRGVCVEGNLFSRRAIRITGQAQIKGNLFAEGNIYLGQGTQIGEQGGYKSVISAGNVQLASNVTVYGWVVAEKGGKVG